MLPQHAQLGFTTIATDTGEWRVFSTIAEGQVIQVAQPMSARRELAASMALRTIVPLAALVPVLALLVWFTIARGLRPLRRVADALTQRSPTQLEPLPETALPQEVEPVVRSLNGLLERLAHALEAQRTFIADAAHELRTPLAAVHLQAQIAERASSIEERSAALSELKAGLERATRLVEQLLALAREEPGVVDRPASNVDLAELARSVIADLAPLASAKGIDLGMVSPPSPAVETVTRYAHVHGDLDALRTLVSNLVDNAVRYAAAEGRVDVAVRREQGAVVLTVRDSGPGIAPADRARVFDRFFRGAAAGAPDAPHGSGLGLAIVKSIALRHRAEIDLGSGIDGAGLGVAVRFPPAAAAS